MLCHGCNSHAHDVLVEPLVLSNGKDLLTMVCRGANTTVNGAAVDEDSHDFCAPPDLSSSLLQNTLHCSYTVVLLF